MVGTVRDHRVWVRDEGTGPPLVFLHNAGTSHRIWDAQVAALASDYRCIAVDLLGYGQSSRPELAYTLPLYVDMLATVLADRDVERPVLIGNCVGSATALQFALHHPERVRGLLLCNLLTERILRAGIIRPLHRATFQWRPVRKLLERGVSVPLPAVLATLSLSLVVSNQASLPSELARHLVSLNADAGQSRVLGNLLSHLDTFSVLDDLRRPPGFPVTWLVWGEDNRILPCAEGARFADRFGPDRFIAIPDAAHLPMAERPALVTAAIRELVDAADRPLTGELVMTSPGRTEPRSVSSE
jgi:pimeloyl-ACP methyl ester carboxylesterase